MCSLAVQRRGSSRLRRRGSSRRHSRRGRSPNSSRVTSIAAAETPEGRGQKAHALGRALSNSSKLRNAKAGRVVRNAKVARVVRNAKSVRSALGSLDMSQEGWPAGHPFLCV